jgi:hypothetical protein
MSLRWGIEGISHLPDVRMAKTYGDKPLVFSFKEGGEEYMIGSEVRN